MQFQPYGIGLFMTVASWECNQGNKPFLKYHFADFKVVVDVKMAYMVVLKINVVETDCIKTLKVSEYHSVSII